MYLNVGDQIISGQFDMFFKNEGLLVDIKTTSMFGKPKPEWDKQLNVYAYMFKHYTELEEGSPDLRELTVKGLKVITVARDWSRARAVKPNKVIPPMAEVNIPLWSEEQQHDFIYNKLNMLGNLKSNIIQKTYDEAQYNLPECSPEENWGGRRCKDYCAVSQFCEQWKRMRGN